MRNARESRRAEDAPREGGGERRWAAAWSRIHLAVLQTLLQFQFLPDSFQQELFTLADMQANIKDVAELLNLLPSGITEDSKIAFTDSLLHHLQVALATGAFRCSHGHSFSTLCYFDVEILELFMVAK